MTVKPCLGCGKNTTNGSRCPSCQQQYLARREASRNRGTRQQRGYTNDWYRVTALAIRRQPFCTYCRSTEDLTGDHITPLSKGGESTLENCRVLCRSCNSRRGNR